MNLSDEFKKEKFNEWMEQVKDWSIANGKYKHAMHVVGSGLSYADLDKSGLPDRAIVGELNKGYISKMVNSRNRINEKIIFLHVSNTEEICDLMHSFLD